MATIINNPGSNGVPPARDSSASGWVVAGIILVALVLLGIYALPRITGSTTTNVIVPSGTTGTSGTTGNPDTGTAPAVTGSSVTSSTTVSGNTVTSTTTTRRY
jgi:predicted permease